MSEASGNGPMIATTYSAHPGGRTTYLVAFSDASAMLAFTPAELGYAGDIYVYDANRRTGRLTAAAATYTDPVAATGSAYYVIAPVGKSGIAFLGDAGKFASTGKKRVSSFSDDGVVTATLVFSAGETATLHGYAADAPTVAATRGTVGGVTYDPSNKRFTVLVTPAAGTATVKLMP